MSRKEEYDTLLEKVNEAVYRRDRLTYKVLTAENSLSRGFAAVSYLQNELHLHSLLNKKPLKRAVAQMASETDPVRIAHLKRVKHYQIHYGSGTKRDLVRRALAASASEKKWRSAKEKGQYWSLSSKFGRLIGISRAFGAKKAEKLGIDSSYEALMDEYDPGRDVRHFDTLVKEMTDFLKPRIKTLPKAEEARKTDPLFALPKDVQHELCHKILAHMGLDMDRLDLRDGPHPTCFGQRDSVLMTMSYDEEDFTYAALAAVHEGGHALFRQNMPKELDGGPAAEVPGQSVDEAMALIFENAHGHSRGFAKFLAETLKKDFGIDRKELTAEKIYDRLQKSGMSLLRGTAGEEVYPLHIVLRYNVARDMIDGGVSAEDMPVKWAAQEYALLGHDTPPANDRTADGHHWSARAMQDIHWYGGKIGYFPCYLTGTLMAAQLLEKSVQDAPEIEKSTENFDTAPLLKWLQEKVYPAAPHMTAEALTEKLTGQKLGTAAFKSRILKTAAAHISPHNNGNKKFNPPFPK